MKLKKYISLILAIVIFTTVLPMHVFAEEYISLKDIADANGYEYFYYEDNDSVNMRSATYILSFQKDNVNVGYKTVVGDVGTITLKNKVKAEGDTLYISKTDAQTKLIRQFPNTPSGTEDVSEGKPSSPTKVPQSNFPSGSVPSDWAINEVNRAKKNGLVTDNTTRNYTSNISREYFCELVMKLYEKITGSTVSSTENPFNDTYNTEILKAYKLGIVNGISSTEFAPNSSITRQEICAMLVRAIGVMYDNINIEDYQYTSFSDSGLIASWAMDSVQFAYDNNIIQGIGDNKIDPLGHATCEQAILLVNRIYENRDNFQGKEDVIETLKRLEFEDNGEVNAVSVSFSDGRDASNVRIREIDSDDLIYTTTGLKGPAVSITTKEDFDTATIAFDYNPNGLGGTNPSDLMVGWYNTDLDRIELLESKVNTAEHTVSVETTHFSEYILVDSKEWYDVWQRGQTIVRETDNNGRFAENFNVQLVVDCSGSMDSTRMSNAKECTYNFIRRLADNDRFSVIKFESNAQTIIKPTLVKDADMSITEKTVMSMSGGGGTDFNAALTECINTLDYSDHSYSNIIVFLSDGEASVNTANLDRLRENNVRIAAVALGNDASTSVMKQLSDSTNGQYVHADDSSDLDAIYEAIQGSLIGVDATDTDGDGLPDIVETSGMKNQYGCVIRTDPNKYDTDGDGASDGEEMGKLIETYELTETDRKYGINHNVYFLMVSDPVEGHRVADKVNATAELRLAATVDDMDDNGMFTLHLKLNVINDVNDLYIKFDTDDCIDWDVSRIEFWHTDFDGSIYKENLLSGDYTVDLEMWCSDINQGLKCSNAHKISVFAVAENADKVSASVTVPNNSTSTNAPAKDPLASIANEILTFNNKTNSYINELKQLDADKIDSEEKQKKANAMTSVKKIPFTVLSIVNAPRDAKERTAMTECFYAAMFDFYMAYYIDDDGGFLDIGNKYYGNISPADFSDLGISAASKMVNDTKDYVKEILKNRNIKNTYTYNGYTYDIEINVPAAGAGMVIQAEFVDKKTGRTYSYTGTTGDNSNIAAAELAMKSYLNELYELYVKANICAIQSAVDEIKSVLTSVDFNTASSKMKKPSLSDKVAKTLEKAGLGKVDDFIGECIEIHNQTQNWMDLADSMKGDDVKKVYDKANKVYNDMDSYFGTILSGNSKKGSVAAINAIQKDIKVQLKKIIDECVKYMNTH